MNNFERITASPEALGDFLGALPILSGPWDDDFHRVFCDSCDAENCDAENCAHQAERNSPTWWLKRAYTGSGPVKTDSTNPYKRQAADLRLEAMHQREMLAKKTCWAIDADPKKPGKVKIIDQEHAAELLEMAKDYLA